MIIILLFPNASKGLLGGPPPSRLFTISRLAPLMKSSLTADALSASLSVWPRNFSSEQSDQSFFSLLLEIETRLRAEARQDSLLQANRRRPARRKNHKRPGVENLSRHIE